MKTLRLLTLLALFCSPAFAGNPPIQQAPLNYNTGSTTISGANVISSVNNRPILLYSVEGYCITSCFIQIYDSTSVPSDASPASPTPKFVVKVPATGNFSVDFDPIGMGFSNGVTWATSTLAAPYNKGSGNTDCFVTVRYLPY